MRHTEQLFAVTRPSGRQGRPRKGRIRVRIVIAFALYV